VKAGVRRTDALLEKALLGHAQVASSRDNEVIMKNDIERIQSRFYLPRTNNV